MNPLNQIEQDLNQMQLNQYTFINPKEIIFSKDVRDMCALNSCGRYNTNWQCPPGVGELDTLECRAKSYEHALMFNTVSPLEDSYDYEGMMAAQDIFTQICSEVLSAVAKVSDDCYIMGAGGCKLCDKCTYPNEPCRFPKKAIASVEACGIDIYTISGKFGFKYINGVNTVTYFGIAFFNL